MKNYLIFKNTKENKNIDCELYSEETSDTYIRIILLILIILSDKKYFIKQ